MRVRIGLFIAALAFTGLAVACGSSGSPTSPMSSPGTGNSMTVSIVRGATNLTTTAYSPNPEPIAAGDMITWTNNDVTTHTSTSDDGSWGSGNIAPGGTFSRTFPSAGTFTYHCAIHPGMVGVVTVR
jgi:plastocyanin